MYDNGASGALAATGTTLIIFGQRIGIGTMVSVGVGVILVGVALVLAVRRTRRNRQENN